MPEEVNSYVTWKGLAVVALTCVGLVSSGIGWGWAQHNQHPHKGAVPRQEYERDITGLEKDIREIRNMLRDIHRDMMKQ